MNFEYIWTFKTFLSRTVKYHKTEKRLKKRMKKGEIVVRKLGVGKWESNREAKNYEYEKKRLGRMLRSSSEEAKKWCVRNGLELEKEIRRQKSVRK
jgi:hypothetical protein